MTETTGLLIAPRHAAARSIGASSVKAAELARAGAEPGTAAVVRAAAADCRPARPQIPGAIRIQPDSATVGPAARAQATPGDASGGRRGTARAVHCTQSGPGIHSEIFVPFALGCVPCCPREPCFERDTEGNAMSGLRYLKGQGPARASAVVRLAAAREELRRAEKRHTAARDSAAEWSALHAVSEAAAEAATREQWLHWIDRGTSRRPEADGDWGQPPDDQESSNRHWVAGRPATAAARRRREAAPGPRPTRLPSAQ